MSQQKRHTVIIEKLVTGGLGLGRLPDGMVALVRYGLPGEKVVIREMHRKKDFVSGALLDIITPSPDRVTPPCPFYGRRGGCDLQHCAYGAQLDLKRSILIEGLQRAPGTGLRRHDAEIQPTVASPADFGYRQRIRLQVDTEGQYGFFGTGSHHLARIDQCLLADKTINTVLRQLHSSEWFPELVSHGSFFELLFNPGRSNIILLLQFDRNPRARDSLLAEKLTGSIAELATVLMQVAGYGLYNPAAQSYAPPPPVLRQTVSPGQPSKDIVLTWEAGGFCQVNLLQNKNLIGLVMKMLRAIPSRRVLDLYCGYGNFSLPAAGIAEEVVGIDSQNAAIRSGRHNLLLNDIANCRFIKGPVAEEVGALIAAGEKFDTVILDPPREGAAAAVSRLAELNAGQIIYISCNPATLARDLALLSSDGYEPSRLVPLDMFPQTHHMESVTLLKRAAKQSP